MGNNTFISDQENWVSTAYSLYSKPILAYVDAVEAMVKANQILRDAPAEAGGSIPFSCPVTEAERLYSKWQDLCDFTNGIHYEAADLIDVPFTQNMGALIESLYDLQPKNFKTEKSFFSFEKEYSLEELLIEMEENAELKKSYESMINDLDTDTIDVSLKESIELADYWANQFEQAKEISQIAKKYTDEHKDEWENYTDEKKLEVLEEYAIEIGAVMYDGNVFEELFNKSVADSVSWDTDDQNERSQEDIEKARGYTYPLSLDGYIYINQNAKTSTNEYDFDSLLETVTHETRHLYQGYAYKEDCFDVPESLKNDWNMRRYIADKYWTSLWEVDARAYAAII